ncbi:PASTA domain-containing protein [Actinoplanes regularis]|uniref:PASTA domain-containing protein n=1 Tax=Actinoplanes regularis TaxID=52697 RepID=A0A239H1W2_9ACTN|nr:PASTA domain-containing protein [Actinoplanes regularis]GIE91769.1 hypothetical protein Are01nite_82490 [Actinoplanes regularis]SNS75162.1 PASTA domain-containing protein [Actinoplanes regularis]
MPDERQPSRDGDASRPDETVADDATQIQPNQPSGRPRSEDTPTAETRPTSPLGGWDPDPRGTDDNPWKGRAMVRPPSTDDDWTSAGPLEEPSGHWWMPIVVGIVSLLLLGLLGYGIYLIVGGSGTDLKTPPQVPTQTRATATPTATTPTTEPTTPTFSTVPTTEPTVTEVTVPALRGLPLADAKAVLDSVGLGYRVLQLPSDAEPGTVIDCDPAEGQAVPPDSKIALVVAAARTGSPASTTTAPTGGATTEPDED